MHAYFFQQQAMPQQGQPWPVGHKQNPSPCAYGLGTACMSTLVTILMLKPLDFRSSRFFPLDFMLL